MPHIAKADLDSKVPIVSPPFQGMVWIPGGTFRMGSNNFYPEERPVHRVTVDSFWMDEHPVTNAEFRRFVEVTGYVTVAERMPDPADYPGVDLSVLVPGSLVFRRPPYRVSLRDPRAWWIYLPGACWYCPEGPASKLDGRERNPVVHVTYEGSKATVLLAKQVRKVTGLARSSVSWPHLV